jgi:hypothetical protein
MSPLSCSIAQTTTVDVIYSHLIPDLGEEQFIVQRQNPTPCASPQSYPEQAEKPSRQPSAAFPLFTGISLSAFPTHLICGEHDKAGEVGNPWKHCQFEHPTRHLARRWLILELP